MRKPQKRSQFVGDVIRSITYKPSASFHFNGDQLELTDTYQDAYTNEPREYTWVFGSVPKEILNEPDRNMARARIINWVWENCALSELHEVAEWLKVDSEPIYGPHESFQGCPVSFMLTFPNGEFRDGRIP